MMHSAKVPMNYERFFSSNALRRKPTILREFARKYRDVCQLSETMDLSLGKPTSNFTPFQDCVLVTEDKDVSLGKDRCRECLQYGVSRGDARLLEWLRRFQIRVHDPPTAKSHDESAMDIIVSPGCQFAVVQALRTMLNPGDFVIVEEYTYSSALDFMNTMGLQFVTVKADCHGMIPESLEESLSGWSAQACRLCTDGSKVPKVIYVVPSAGNPTGITLTEERRRRIYKIARDYDLMIIEDDPYYFLDFSENHLPSFLSIDIDGRVLRGDSFSKIMSAGIRLGFLTGPKKMVERVNWGVQVINQHCSGLTQAVIHRILQQWGTEKLEEHLAKIKNFYRNQKDTIVCLAQKHLNDVATWNEPDGGMFMWVKILGVEDSEDLVEKFIQEKVLCLPGNAFKAGLGTQKSPYIRLSFSEISPEKIEKAFLIIKKVIQIHSMQRGPGSD